jgi:hypothetical protein
MSSPKAATKPLAKSAQRAKPRSRAKRPARAGVKVAAKLAAKPAGDAATSAQATQLAAEIERGLADGRNDMLTPAALHALMGAACKAYAAQVEAGNPMAALGQRTTVTPTEVMVTASGLLRAANLAVFELGMWQSWTGR